MKIKIVLFTTFIMLWVLGLMGGKALAQIWIMANGGSYWQQYGSAWNRINNDGYCVAGRGPCSSNLWYLQWSKNHSGCGFDEYAKWTIPSSGIKDYNGDTYAWIDKSTGDMYGADYSVVYNGVSTYYSTVNQSKYYEAWAQIALDKKRTSIVWLTDGWGNQYTCNGVGGKQVEFDEVKLEI